MHLAGHTVVEIHVLKSARITCSGAAKLARVLLQDRRDGRSRF